MHFLFPSPFPPYLLLSALSAVLCVRPSHSIPKPYKNLETSKLPNFQASKLPNFQTSKLRNFFCFRYWEFSLNVAVEVSHRGTETQRTEKSRIVTAILRVINTLNFKGVFTTWVNLRFILSWLYLHNSLCLCASVWAIMRTIHLNCFFRFRSLGDLEYSSKV